MLTGKWRSPKHTYLQFLDTVVSWRFRRIVPKHLLALIGKTEWKGTLKARTENEAVWLLQSHIAKTDRIIALAEAGNWPPIDDEIIDVVFTAWKHAEAVAMISSAEIPYSVERFLAGPREVWFEIPLQIGDRAHAMGNALPDQKAISAVLDNPDRLAPFQGNRDAVHRLIRQCRRYVAVQAPQKGLVEPFNVADPTPSVRLWFPPSGSAHEYAGRISAALARLERSA